MSTYALGSLDLLPSILSSGANQGLYGSTLYEVLDPASSVPGNATVNATGFDVTCGFLPVPIPLVFSAPSPLDVAEYYWEFSAGNVTIQEQISSTQPGMITTAIPSYNASADIDIHALVLYSTIPVIDSGGSQGQRVELSPQMKTSMSSIQVFRCALELVSQVGIVDIQTQKILSIQPDLTKTTSTWKPYTVTSEFEFEGFWYPNVTTDSMLTNLVGDSIFPSPTLILKMQWETWYQLLPSSNFLLDYSRIDGYTASIEDVLWNAEARLGQLALATLKNRLICQQQRKPGWEPREQKDSQHDVDLNMEVISKPPLIESKHFHRELHNRRGNTMARRSFNSANRPIGTQCCLLNRNSRTSFSKDLAS
ncbi:hypothetical protein C8R45DRAFT_938681 [Mycena sanguinolenta]|nr:hypothetical protein C8R45DRAFT_938681 [Mycena sanguinolenta]